MKLKLLLLFLFILNIFNSCSEGKKEQKENSEVHFVVEGTVKNGDGKKLALHVPSLKLDNRLISPIKNGKFRFEGKLPKPEGATISFEDEHRNVDGSMSVYQVFLTNDTIQIGADVAEKFGNLFLKNDTILKGEMTDYFYRTKDEFYEAYSGAMIYRDSLKQDSLRRMVYPTIRKNVLNRYDKLYSAPEHSIIALFFLRGIMEDKSLFQVGDLKDSEKAQLTEYFNRIPTSYEGTPDYTVVASKIERMVNPESFGGFMDFSLPDEKNVEQKLSEIINQNEYTVLDFWWSGCRPCRVFNREGQEQYSELREAGIEIVGINVDDGREKWEKASESDNLKWINLYAGANSKIQSDYNVIAFPAKVIVNKNLELVNIQFKTAKELLALLSRE